MKGRGREGRRKRMGKRRGGQCERNSEGGTAKEIEREEIVKRGKEGAEEGNVKVKGKEGAKEGNVKGRQKRKGQRRRERKGQRKGMCRGDGKGRVRERECYVKEIKI